MFEIDVNSNAVKATGNLVGRLQDLQKPLDETGAYLERRAVLRFVKQKDPSGKPWAPLRPGTLAEKKRLGKSSAILRRDGSMVASIAWAVSGSEVRVKPSVEYAIFHQTGTKKMPARVFMGFEPSDSDAIGRIFRDHLEGK